MVTSSAAFKILYHYKLGFLEIGFDLAMQILLLEEFNVVSK